jgi:predicted negative regulator of RcsB-dependent stress response
VDDLSEREQIERIRQWWRENGWYIVGGVVLGALLITGWNRYQAYQEGRAEQAAALYQNLADAVAANNQGTAADLLATLRSEHGASPYATQGGLLMARLHLRQNDAQGAARTLREVMSSARDPDMALVARLRLARVLAYQEAYQEALDVLAVSEPGQFAARFSEVRGDVYVALGNEEAARDAYVQALIGQGSELVDRNFLQMKLNDLAVADAMPAGLSFPGEGPVIGDFDAPGALPGADVPAAIGEPPAAGEAPPPDEVPQPPAGAEMPEAPAVEPAGSDDDARGSNDDAREDDS